MKRFIIVMAACLGLLSCQSMQTPVDRGAINPTNAPDTELATVHFDKYLSIEKIDDKNPGWVTPEQKGRDQFVKLPAGVHTFSVNFNNGSVYTIFPQTVIGNFEKGKEYAIEGKPAGKKLKLTITDSADGKDVAMDFNKLRGDDPGVLPSYIKYILNPTMEKSNKSVKLENADMILVYKPDMTYIQTNKATGTAVSGYAGFIMNFAMSDGKVYLLETDVTKMTKDDFLNKSDYENVAQTVLVPTKCDAKSVTYKYLKPDSLKDTAITFSIEEF